MQGKPHKMHIKWYIEKRRIHMYHFYRRILIIRKNIHTRKIFVLIVNIVMENGIKII